MTSSSRALCAAAVLALLAGCGSSKSTSSASPDPKVKVGVLIPGSISDEGYMQSAYEGVVRIKQQLAGQVEISYIEKVQPANYQQALVRFASTDQLVISIGGQTDADVRKVAPKFPKVKFVEVGGPTTTLPNLAMYDPKQGEIAFLGGAYAALSSKTGKVGFVAGVEIPPIVATAKQFAAGAKYARPDVTVLPPQYTGDFDDVAKAKQAVQADVSAGGDVFYQILNNGLQGMLQGAKETGTHVLGGPLVQPCGASPVFIGHTKSDIGAATEYAVKQYLAGTWKAEAKSFGLNSGTGASDIKLCGAAPGVSAKIAQIKADLTAGKITTG
ncbi:BMP family protein [Streptomyces cavernae]|uniref:BMP family protein n=1 Tax=Streptomyces cavernae TaxID=2259034 RepID=UPI000FEB5F01|nr:BMP family protein [Streptomyces cavernae]